MDNETYDSGSTLFDEISATLWLISFGYYFWCLVCSIAGVSGIAAGFLVVRAFQSTDDNALLLMLSFGAVMVGSTYACFEWAGPQMQLFSGARRRLEDALRLSKRGNPEDEFRARAALAQVEGALKPPARAERIARHGEP